jgi:hypothetical protein
MLQRKTSTTATALPAVPHGVLRVQECGVALLCSDGAPSADRDAKAHRCGSRSRPAHVRRLWLTKSPFALRAAPVATVRLCGASAHPSAAGGRTLRLRWRTVARPRASRRPCIVTRQFRAQICSHTTAAARTRTAHRALPALAVAVGRTPAQGRRDAKCSCSRSWRSSRERKPGLTAQPRPVRRNRRGIRRRNALGRDASSHQCCQLRRPEIRRALIALQLDEVKQPCTHLRLLCRVPRRCVVAAAPLLMLPLALKRDLKAVRVEHCGSHACGALTPRVSRSCVVDEVENHEPVCYRPRYCAARFGQCIAPAMLRSMPRTSSYRDPWALGQDQGKIEASRGPGPGRRRLAGLPGWLQPQKRCDRRGPVLRR